MTATHREGEREVEKKSREKGKGGRQREGRLVLSPLRDQSNHRSPRSNQYRRGRESPLISRAVALRRRTLEPSRHHCDPRFRPRNALVDRIRPLHPDADGRGRVRVSHQTPFLFSAKPRLTPPFEKKKKNAVAAVLRNAFAGRAARRCTPGCANGGRLGWGHTGRFRGGGWRRRRSSTRLCSRLWCLQRQR